MASVSCPAYELVQGLPNKTFTTRHYLGFVEAKQSKAKR